LLKVLHPFEITDDDAPHVAGDVAADEYSVVAVGEDPVGFGVVGPFAPSAMRRRRRRASSPSIARSIAQGASTSQGCSRRARIEPGFCRPPRERARFSRVLDSATSRQRDDFVGAHGVFTAAAGMPGQGEAQPTQSSAQLNISLAWIASQMPNKLDAEREHNLESFRYRA
jgi:hypothetical protein